MPVKYLSQEWIDAHNAAMADDAVRDAVTGKSATIQMVVSDAPTVQTALAAIDTEY